MNTARLPVLHSVIKNNAAQSDDSSATLFLHFLDLQRLDSPIVGPKGLMNLFACGPFSPRRLFWKPDANVSCWNHNMRQKWADTTNFSNEISKCHTSQPEKGPKRHSSCQKKNWNSVPVPNVPCIRREYFLLLTFYFLLFLKGNHSVCWLIKMHVMYYNAELHFNYALQKYLTNKHGDFRTS